MRRTASRRRSSCCRRWVAVPRCAATAAGASAIRAACCCRANGESWSTGISTWRFSTTPAKSRRGPRISISIALKDDFGVGLRFHGPFATPLRVELAKSREGLAFVFSRWPPLSKVTSSCERSLVSSRMRRVGLVVLSAGAIACLHRRRLDAGTSGSIPTIPSAASLNRGTPRRRRRTTCPDVRAGLQPVRHLEVRAERPAREERQHDRRSAGLELVHQSHRREADHERRARCAARTRGSRRIHSKLGPDPREDLPACTPDSRRETARATPGSSSSIRRISPKARRPRSRSRSKIFWALGYNQVESFLTTFDPKKTSIDPQATVRRPSGKRTPFTKDDMNVILENVARNADGTYRVIAGRLLSGKILGGYQYSGTRPDDPNDLVPHEDRRELRALRVFGAWTNLTDLKATNTLDTLSPKTARPSSSTTCRTLAPRSACATTSTSGT